MMLRIRGHATKLLGCSFLKIDLDNGVYILQTEDWDNSIPSVFWPEDMASHFTEELWEWLPER